MNAGRILSAYLILMGLLIVFGLFFPQSFLASFQHPDFYLPVKLIHVVSASLLFGNTVIGTLWELRSLKSRRLSVIKTTYQTVVWLDAVFTAPVILSVVLSGISLGTMRGGVWTMGWLSIAFCIFLAAGSVWIAVDIPSQYRIHRICQSTPDTEEIIPPKLCWWLKLRVWVNSLSIFPFLIIYYLMVQKPELPTFSMILR